MYKKILSIGIVMSLMAGILSGCSKKNSKDSKEKVIPSTSEGKGEVDTDESQVESVAAKYRALEEERREQDVYYDDSDLYSDACKETEENYYDVTAEDAEGSYSSENDYYFYDNYDTREYSYEQENKFVSTQDRSVSTFAADVDTASYSNIRGYINSYSDVPASAVRIEEMINYFHYSKTAPAEGEKFGVTTECGACPWNENNWLLYIELNTEDIDFKDAVPSNLVFLIDTSGSMYDSNKLPLAQKAFDMLAEELDEDDRVSIVTYAGSETIVLTGTPGNETYTITEAIDSLEASGSTNGGMGIIAAYELAEEYYIPGGNNRVILATDGDMNVGITSEGDLTNLVAEEKENGIYLSILGFGNDNLKDNKLESMADNGNGNYSFIDSVYEAKKVLVDEMGGTLYTVAKDVKLQIEFNPDVVAEYRLIGYENRLLNQEDFNDDTVDGGEIGAGHTVVALYEIVPAGGTDRIGELSIRYKEPDEDASKLQTCIIESDPYPTADVVMSDDMEFAAAVALFGMILSGSDYCGDGNIETVIALAESSSNDEYREEFLALVDLYYTTNYNYEIIID